MVFTRSGSAGSHVATAGSEDENVVHRQYLDQYLPALPGKLEVTAMRC